MEKLTILLKTLELNSGIVDLTLFRMGEWGRGAKSSATSFFPRDFHKLLQLSDIYFYLFCHIRVKFQGYNYCQSQIIEPKPSAPRDKILLVTS